MCGGAVNRAYYGIFWAVTCVHLLDGNHFKKHKESIGIFNRDYINTGIFPKEFGRKIHNAADARNLYVKANEITAQENLEFAKELLTAVKNYCEEKLNGIERKKFEESISDYLCAAGGYIYGDAKKFDKALALDTETLLKFIKNTQAKEFKKLASRITENVENYFVKSLCSKLDEKNIIEVLREPLEMRGCKFRLVYWKPETNLNPETVELYQKNILTCVRQLHYSKQNNNSLDMVLFENGFPLKPNYRARRSKRN